MAAGVHEHPAAGQFGIQPPAADADPTLRNVGDDSADLAQRAFAHQFPRVDEVGHPVALIGHHQSAFPLHGEVEQALGLTGRDDQRLLHQHMQSSFQAGLDLVVVVAVRGADQCAVGVDLPSLEPLDERAPAAEVRHVAAGLVHELPSVRFHRIGDGDDLHRAIGLDARQVGVSHVAASAHEHHGQSFLRHVASSPGNTATSAPAESYMLGPDSTERQGDIMRIGIYGGNIRRGKPLSSLVDEIIEKEEQGFASYWTPQVGTFDALTLLALAGQATSRIELGTAVVPSYPRHPSALAQQAATVNALCGGRLVLGVGPSHAPGIEGPGAGL